MKKLSVALGLAAGIALSPLSTQAQVQIGPTLAFHGDYDLGIGATLSVQMPALGERIGAIGEFLVFFPSNDAVDYLEINGNFTYDFIVEGTPVTPFALAGLNVARRSVTMVGGADVDETDIGLNLGGGLRFEAGPLKPMVGVRYEVGGGEDFVIFGTLPFEVGTR